MFDMYIDFWDMNGDYIRNDTLVGTGDTMMQHDAQSLPYDLSVCGCIDATDFTPYHKGGQVHEYNEASWRIKARGLGRTPAGRLAFYVWARNTDAAACGTIIAALRDMRRAKAWEFYRRGA